MFPVAKACLTVALGTLATAAIAATSPSSPSSPPAPAIAGKQWNDLAPRDGADAVIGRGQAYAYGAGLHDIPQARRWLRHADAATTPEAQRERGLLLLRGDGVPRNPEQAAALLRQAAEAGDPRAQAVLGALYAFGDGLAQDWPLALDWSRKAAERNDAWGQTNLGLFLESGHDGAPQPAQAARWYQKAANQGFALAQARLGLLYQNGAGVAADPRRAFMLYLQAAQRNDPVGQRLLGLAFRDGVGVPTNQAEAAAWLNRAADGGDSDAMYLLSGFHADGRGVAKNRARAWRFMLDAAEHGHALAAARAGNAYVTGEFGVDPDPAEAARWLDTALAQAARDAAFTPEDPTTFRGRQLTWARYQLGLLLTATDPARAAALFRQASEHDCPAAAYQLARLYRHGTTVARDDATAAKLFEAAANGGIAAAAHELADGYATGWAGERSAAVALRWYRRAAALGHPEAWLALGRAYEEAREVARDGNEALTWYQLAANAGNVAARLRLGDVACSGILDQPRNDKLALRWYGLAADQGSAVAEEDIGDLYWQGSQDVPRDRAEAVRHYQAAATHGRASAQRKLALAMSGQPLFPIEEVPVPSSVVPGEVASKTQPIPKLPAPYTRQAVTEETLTNVTPESHAWAVKQWASLVHGGAFTPPQVDKLIANLPGFAGGAEWGGAAVDPTSGVIYVNENDTAWLVGLTVPPPPGSEGEKTYQNQCSGCHGINRAGSPPLIPSLRGVGGRRTDEEISVILHGGKGRMPSFAGLGDAKINDVIRYLTKAPLDPESTRKAEANGGKVPGDDLMPYKTIGFSRFTDPQGYPAVSPPWGTLNAIDLNTGKYLWRIPFGEYPELKAKGIKPTGSDNYGGPVVTAGGLLFIGATVFDSKFHAYDSHTGKLLWETDLPYAGLATPATYSIAGKQYVVIAAGGGQSSTKPSGGVYVAYALP